MKEKVDDLSEKELVEYSRHKTSYMYQKYGTYRFISAMIIGIGLAAGISYAYRNRLKSVVGSLLMHNCKNMFLSNPKIINLKKMNKEL